MLLCVWGGPRCFGFWGGALARLNALKSSLSSVQSRPGDDGPNDQARPIFSYVPASPSQFPRIAELLSSAFDSPGFPFKFISRASFTAELRERHSRLVQSTGRNHTMIVCISPTGEVVGFLELGVLPMGSPEMQRSVREFAVSSSGGGSTSSSDEENGAKLMRYPVIGNLVIKETFRRQGIARQLLMNAERAAIAWGGQYDRLVVAVDPLNTPAVQLYASLGFTRVATAKQKIVKDLMQQEKLFATMVKGLL